LGDDDERTEGVCGVEDFVCDGARLIGVAFGDERERQGELTECSAACPGRRSQLKDTFGLPAGLGYVTECLHAPNGFTRE
jgi:hypothetical protein